MHKSLLFITLLLYTVQLSYAQHKQPDIITDRDLIQGVVLDIANEQPIREASVSLLQARDSSYVTFSLTDGNGRYILRGVRPGKYLLLFHILGYKVVQQPIEMLAGRASVNVAPQHLVVESQNLGDVVVIHERPPVSVHGDTVAFSANAFKTQPNATVEQLLKKLPGVEIARDGSIRAQGQSVDNVLVDGKPFFGGDPKMATRNLPAAILDRVELFDKQDDQAAFAGLDGGEHHRTINLVTRRDKRRGLFGTEQAGAGIKGQYNVRLGLNRFNNNRQLSILAQADNVNGQGYTDTGNPASGGGGPTRGGAGSISNNSGGLTLASPGGVRNLGLDGTSNPETGVIESASSGVNYRDILGKRLEIAGSYLAARSTTLNDQQAHRQNLLTDIAAPVSLTDQNVSSHILTNTQRATLRLDYQIDSLTSLRLTPSFNYQGSTQRRAATQQTTLASQLLNQNTSVYEAEGNNFTGGGTALILRKFHHPDRSLSVNTTVKIANQDGVAFNQSTTNYLSAPLLRLNQQITQKAPNLDGLLNLSYVEPLSLRHKLEGHYSYGIVPSQARRSTFDYDSSKGDYSRSNIQLSNDFRSRFAAHRAGLIWQTHRLRYTYSVGLDGQLMSQHLDNQTADVALRRSYPGLLPQASFSYTGAGSRTLRLIYHTQLTPPAALQLQPVSDLSDPLNVQRGNPELQPEYTHDITINYQHFNAEQSRSISLLLAGSTTQNRVVSATTIDAGGGRTTQPVNADGYYQASGFLALGKRLPVHQFNLNASTSANLSRSPSFINDQPNLAYVSSLGQTFSVNSAYNEHLELSLQANFLYQKASYSLANVPSTTSFIQTTNADIFWRITSRWNIASELSFINNNGLTANYNPRVLRWNVNLAYQMLASRRGEVKLFVFDLLNQNRSVIRTATDTYVEDVRSRVLTRYLLLSFSYQLRNFGK